MNIGTAEGTVNIRGLKKSIRDLRKTQVELEKLGRSVTNNIHKNKEFVSALKAKSALHAKVLSEAKGTRQAHVAVTKALNIRIKALKHLQAIRRRVISTKASSITSGLFSGVRGSLTAVSSLGTSFSRLGAAIKKNNEGMQTWWSRFGGVAAGFWIAYRAINAVEFAISNLTKTFTSGVTMVDEYRQSVATVAGMLALMNNKTGTFASQYERFQTVMQQTMRESIRLAPRYALSVDEVGNAYKELSQFGVIVQRDMVDNTLSAIGMIREIAATTGSTARQVRQEIQSLFTGTTRVTDQFGRMIKRSFPELSKSIFGITAANVSNAEKWKLVIDRMSEFKIANEDIRKTLQRQAIELKTNIQVISGLALETSHIYDGWVQQIRDFNDQLFNADGTLAAMGEKIYSAFFRVWQIIRNMIKSIAVFWNFGKDLFHIIQSWIAPASHFIGILARWAILVAALKTSYSLVFSIVKPLWKLLGGSVMLSLVKNTILLVVQFRKFFGVIALVVGALTAGYQIGKQINGIFSGLGALLGAISVPLATFFSSLWEQFKALMSNIGTFVTSPLDTIKKFLRGEDVGVVKIPKLDLSGFTGLGAKASAAFSSGYNEGISAVEDGTSLILDAAKDKVKVFFAGLKSIVTDSKLFDRLVTVKDQLLELLALEPVTLPNFTEWTGNIDASVDSGVSSLDKMLAKLKTMADYISTEFKSVFTDVFSGQIKTFASLWDNILGAMVHSFEKAMADLTQSYFDDFIKQTFFNKSLKQFAGAIGNFIGSAFTSQQATANNNLEAFHAEHGFASGGIITEPVFGVGRSGQTYSFAEQGPERILSNSDSFTQPQQAPTVVVNVVNKTSKEVDAEQGAANFDGRKYIVETILKDVDQGGNLRGLFRR